MIDLNLKDLSINELETLTRKIDYEKREREEKAIKEKVNDHASLVGKCFKAKMHSPYLYAPEMWRYYKVINSRASNEYRISVLTFEEYPFYNFDYIYAKKDFIGNHYFGKYDFKGIRIQDFPFFCYNNMFTWQGEELHRGPLVGDNLIEISLEEYNEAMNTYINRLQKLDWPADHYRGKSKKPGDPGWEEESK